MSNIDTLRSDFRFFMLNLGTLSLAIGNAAHRVVEEPEIYKANVAVLRKRLLTLEDRIKAFEDTL